MAKFLTTSGITYRIEDIIKNTNVTLILISPYLQFSERIRDHIQEICDNRYDIKIVYRENKLQPADSKWLENLEGVRKFLKANLHAKCYLNENEALITSMNLYEFSQENNYEMGIYVTKEDDNQLYEEIFKEAQKLIKGSQELAIKIEKVDSELVDKKIEVYKAFRNRKSSGNSKLMSSKELGIKLGYSTKKVNAWFVENKLMFMKDKNYYTTKKGKEHGGIEKEGYYRQEVHWPDAIIDIMELNDLPF